MLDPLIKRCCALVLLQICLSLIIIFSVYRSHRKNVYDQTITILTYRALELYLVVGFSRLRDPETEPYRYRGRNRR